MLQDAGGNLEPWEQLLLDEGFEHTGCLGHLRQSLQHAKINIQPACLMGAHHSTRGRRDVFQNWKVTLTMKERKIHLEIIQEVEFIILGKWRICGEEVQNDFPRYLTRVARRMMVPFTKVVNTGGEEKGEGAVYRGVWWVFFWCLLWVPELETLRKISWRQSYTNMRKRGTDPEKGRPEICCNLCFQKRDSNRPLGKS